MFDASKSKVQLGRLLRRRREELGLEQGDVAAKAEVSQSYLSKIESGAQEPSAAKLITLARVLKTHPRPFIRAAIVVKTLDLRCALEDYERHEKSAKVAS